MAGSSWPGTGGGAAGDAGEFGGSGLDSGSDPADPPVELDPAEAAVERARMLIALGRLADAEPMLRRTLASDPLHYGALTNLAWLLASAERTEEAEEVARQVIAAFPEDSEGYRRMAWVLRDSDRPAEAEPFARRAVELDPHDPAAYRVLAAVLWNLPEHSAEALAASGRAVELAPQEAENLAFEAIALVNLRRWADASVAAHAALALDPTDSGQLAQCGLINLRLGNGEEARTQFQSALRLSPTPAQAQDVLENLETHGVPEPLTDIYERLCLVVGVPDLTVPGAAGDDPALLDRQARLASSMYSSSVYDHPWSKATRDRVLPVLDSILAAAPGHVPARELMAKIADEEDRYGDTLAVSSALIAEGFGTIRLHRYVIKALRELDRIDDALAAADEACRRFPEAAEPHALRAEALANLDRLDEALAAAYHAVELAPDDPDQHQALAQILAAADQPDAAKKALLAALDLDPRHVGARFELGSLRMFAYQDYPGAAREFASIDLPDPSGQRGACLGYTRFLIGEWDLAVADFDTALARPMRIPATPRMIADVLEDFAAPGPFRPIYERSLAAIGRAAPHDLETAEKYITMAGILLKFGADARAATLIDEALRLEPDNDSARLLAEGLADPDDPETAAALAALRYVAPVD